MDDKQRTVQIREIKLPDFEAQLQKDPQLRSPHTIRGYRRDLTAFELWRNGRPLTKLLVQEYARELQLAGKSPGTVNRALSAVRWWARRLGDLAYEPAGDHLTADQRRQIGAQTARVAAVRGIKGRRLPKGRQLATREIAALLRACSGDERPTGRRDAAVISIAWMTGLRRGELVSLNVADISPTEDDGAAFYVVGKGGHARNAYIYENALIALDAWLKVRGRHTAGPLFCPVLKNGRPRVGRSMTTEALAQMLAKRANEAALTEPVTWHDFRRTFASNLLDAGHDLLTVQQLMGHVSPVTTSLYDRRGEHNRRDAVKSLQLPKIDIP